MAVVECPGTGLKGGSRKLSLHNYSWLSDFFPKVMAEGLPDVEPNQVKMIA